MKKFFLFLLLYGFVIGVLNGRSLVAPAVCQIMRNFYSVKDDQFDLIVTGTNPNDLNDILDDLVKFERENYRPVGIVYFRVFDGIIKINRSAIVMFNNLQSYREFIRRILLVNLSPKNFHFLFYVNGIHEPQARKLLFFKDFASHPAVFHFISFLVHDETNSLKILTFSMFKPPSCRDWITIEVNRFSRKSKQWIDQEFFPEKFNNFNGCELVAVVIESEPSVKLDISRTTADMPEGVYWGYAFTLHLELAAHLNFTPKYKSLRSSSQNVKGDYHLCAAQLRRNYLSTRDVTITNLFTTSDELILVSRFKPYSQFDKFVMPFDAETWHWLCATIIIAVAVIVIFNVFAPQSMRYFVIGRFVRTPLLNFV